MDYKDCFRILGISETKDEQVIKNAYRELLTQVNPEDDADGFMRLREAYEGAMAYTRVAEEDTLVQEAVWMEEGPVGEFLQQVAGVYANLPKRMDIQEWKAVLKHPILESLEDGEEAKWKLFAFLADHYRLQCKVWQLLDEYYFIVENKTEFEEHLPVQFVDYMAYKICDKEGKSDFWYEELQGDPEANYDEFIDVLMDLMREGEAPEEECSLGRLEDMISKVESYEIHHPWFELEKANYYFKSGDSQKAECMMRELLEKYSEDEKICLGSAALFQKLGQDEDAKNIYLTWKEKENCEDGLKYRIFYELGRIAQNQKDLKAAREYALDARRVWHTKEIEDMIQELSLALIDMYTEKAELLSSDDARDFVWCYYDLRRAQEGLDFYETYPQYVEDTKDYHKQMTFLYAGVQDGTHMLEEAKIWRGYITDDEDDSKVQIGNSYYMECVAHRMLMTLDEIEEEKKEMHFQLAKECIDQAIEIDTDSENYRMEKVALLREKKMYREVSEECQFLLEKNDRNFGALFYLQEAYEEMRMAQNVIDTFYRAKEIYQGEPQIYQRAMKVFEAYGQYEDAMGIYEQAEEAGIGNAHVLLVEKISLLEQMSESPEEKAEADAFAESVITRLTEEQGDAKLLAKAFLNRAYLNEMSGEQNAGKRKAAAEYAEKSLELDDNIDVRYFLGRFYEKYNRESRRAFEHLKVCEEKGMEFEWMYFYIARCYESFKEWDNAIVYYKKMAEQNPDSSEAYWRIAWLYRGKFNRTEQKEYAELSLKYVDIHEEKNGETAENHRWRANTYRMLGQTEPALEEIERGIEMEADSGMWFLKGQILRKMRRFEEAMECYLNSINAKDRYGEDDENSYRNIFQCYLRHEDIKKGIEFFENVIKTELSESVLDKCLECLSDLEGQNENYKKALYWQEQRYKSLNLGEKVLDSWEKEADRMEDVLTVVQKFQWEPEKEYYDLIKQAEALTTQAYEDEQGALEERAHMCHNLGERYYYACELELAYQWLDKARILVEEYERTNKDSKYEYRKELWDHLTRVTYWLKDKKNNEIYGKKWREEIEAKYSECADLNKSMEDIMTSEGVSKNEIYALFMHAYFVGDYEKAAKYEEIMSARDMCYWCSENGCTEMYEIKGFLALHENREEDAVALFKQAALCGWLGKNRDATMALQLIGKNRKKI